jgi:hypothetical protein
METACVFCVFLQEIDIDFWSTANHELELISCNAIEVSFRHHFLKTFFDSVDLENGFVDTLSLDFSDIIFLLFEGNFDIFTIVDDFMFLSITGVKDPSNRFRILLNLCEHFLCGHIFDDFESFDKSIVIFLEIRICNMFSN